MVYEARSDYILTATPPPKITTANRIRQLTEIRQQVLALPAEKALQAINKKSVEDVAWIPLHYQQDIFAVVKGKNVKFMPRSDRWIVAKEIK